MINKNDHKFFNNANENVIGSDKYNFFNLKAFTNKNNDNLIKNNIFTNTNINETKFKIKNENENKFLNSSSVIEDLNQTQNNKTLTNLQSIKIIPNAFSTSTLDENINDLHERKKDIKQAKDLSFKNLIKNSNNFKQLNDSTIIVCAEKSGIPRLLKNKYNRSKNDQICIQQSSNFLPLIPITSCKSSSEFQEKKNNKTLPITLTKPLSKTKKHIPHSKSFNIQNTINRNLLFKDNNNKVPPYARKKSLQSRYHQSCQN